MTTDFNDVVKQGFVKIRSRRFWVYQKYWLVMRGASSRGPKRLEKYSNEHAANTHCYHKVIKLTNVRNVIRHPQQERKCAVTLVFNNDSKMTFVCESEMEAGEWYSVLQTECIQVKKKDISFAEPDLLSHTIHRDQSKKFHVFLMPSPSFSFSGECVLHITQESIYLQDTLDPQIKIASWPLRVLRRYGRDQTWFTFEAGRMCDTGEGLFKFRTVEGEAIYQKVHSAVLVIAETQNQPVRVRTIENIQNLTNNLDLAFFTVSLVD
ncbi:docking protein 5-like [Chanos chanos]|uniref:Docking protein 5-like n=1 Tax=Chanos chanos TaxID=29144 RepID=A0A6J2VPV8_CHACN|nr:docking protein 5-like [Chanos chanos]